MADRQDKAALATNEVGPIKPSKKAKTASVEEARKSAEAVSVASGAAAKAAKKAQLKAEAESPKVTKKPTQAQRLSSLEDKIEMLTNLLALQMQGEQGTSVDAVSIEELPFQL